MAKKRNQQGRHLVISRKIERPFFTLAHDVLNFMTFYVDCCDRNGHTTSNVFHCYAMISSLAMAKVVGLQSPFISVILEMIHTTKKYKSMLLWIVNYIYIKQHDR